MTRPQSLVVSLAALIFTSLVTSANAAVPPYTTEASFNANATAVDVRNFEGIAAADPGYLIINTLPFELSGPGPLVSISSNASASNVIVYTGGQVGGFDQASFVSQRLGSPNEITVSVAGSGATALGFMYGSPSSAGVSFSITVLGSAGPTSPLFHLTDLALPASTFTPAFIGFASDAPITSVIFSANDVFQLGLLQVSVGTALPVPEPSTYAMFGAGLALFGMIGRRRSRRL